MTIISGGQTGADLGALKGAYEIGLMTGGWAPKGWYNELGRMENFMRSYHLKECPVIGYPARSMRNVDDSDATVAILWDTTSQGTMKTIGYAQFHKWKHGLLQAVSEYKPLLIIRHKDLDTAVIQLMNFYVKDMFKVINVAGHRRSSHPDIEEFTKQLIIKAFERK